MVQETTDLDQIDLDYPIIVKPTDRSGSRGICKLQDRKGLREAVEHAQEESFENQVLVEEYVTGTEYSVEYISYQGEHHFLAMTLKRTNGSTLFY